VRARATIGSGSPLLPRPVAMLPTIDHMAVRIEPLTPDRIADLATLFDQGGDPKWCWCAYFRVRGRDWTNSTGAENRRILESAVEEQDHAPGLVAYEDDVAVGWVSLGPREDYERLAFSKVMAPVDDKAVWSIVCFVVGRRSRGQGIAVALLDGAIEYSRAQGATMLEGYPVDIAEGERIPSANAYHGTLAMFERAGFKVVERRKGSPTAAARPIVRKSIRPRKAPPR
jgi:GNAT superfamily N-acetyltransferase